ncbi:MAG: dATP/dGTP pyrophosphohydrolase domain-containing protein [Verrucomicrobiota bacterium]
MTLQQLQQEIGAWSEMTFDDETPLPKLHHLRQEVAELIAAPYDKTEYADCLILLIDAARKAGISAEELIRAADEKMEINRRRTWSEPDQNGVVHHLPSMFEPAQPELFSFSPENYAPAYSPGYELNAPEFTK